MMKFVQFIKYLFIDVIALALDVAKNVRLKGILKETTKIQCTSTSRHGK